MYLIHIPLLSLSLILMTFAHNVCMYMYIYIKILICTFFFPILTVRQHLPWPLRVYESSDCVIELCMAYRVDLEYHTNSEVNYMALLHWYGSDGSHYKLDLRRLIRKEYRKVNDIIYMYYTFTSVCIILPSHL